MAAALGVAVGAVAARRDAALLEVLYRGDGSGSGSGGGEGQEGVAEEEEGGGGELHCCFLGWKGVTVGFVFKRWMMRVLMRVLDLTRGR